MLGPGGISVEQISMFRCCANPPQQGTRLSGGEQQMLACALLRNGSRLLLLDVFPRPGPGDRAKVAVVVVPCANRVHDLMVEENSLAAPLAPASCHGTFPVIEHFTQAERPSRMERLMNT